MKIIKEIPTPKHHDNTSNTLHLTKERFNRINTYINKFGKGIPVNSFVVDTKHENGLEEHVICSNRLVYIYNQNSTLLITVLYARPAQLKRYYNALGLKFNKVRFDKYEEGYNEI